MAPLVSGLLAAHRNDRAEAERIMKFLATPFAAKHEGYHPAAYVAAGIAASLGERDRAIGLLRSIVDKGELVVLPVWLHRDPNWNVLRDYPSFQELSRPRE